MEILNFKGPLSDLIHILKKGGSIHIKKKNRGKFTEYCGGKVTEECIAKGKKSKDPKIRKRATFAANARKWKHENGGPLRRPNFKESREAYYDPETDTVFAPDSLGEFYHHEMFHARPNLQLLESLKPYYHNLNDDVLKQMGADLSFVKRFNNDPGHFYSPEELGARVVSASEMLNKIGVKDVTLDFLKNARINENTYGDNFRDLLHMYNDENLIKIFNTVKKHENGGIVSKYKDGEKFIYPDYWDNSYFEINTFNDGNKSKEEELYEKTVPEVPYRPIDYSYYPQWNIFAHGLKNINQEIEDSSVDLYSDKNATYYKDKDNNYYVFNHTGDSGVINPENFKEVPYSEIRGKLAARDYIGGDKRDVGIKVIEKIPNLKETISKLSDLYNISKDVFTQRLINEGWLQQIASNYNSAGPNEQKNFDWNSIMDEPVYGQSQLGLDTFGNYFKAGKLNLRRNINFEDVFGQNEDKTGKEYNSANFKNAYDALEAKAAVFEYFTKIAKERNIPEEDIDAYVNAMYNMGPYHNDLNNMDYVRRTYSITPYFKLGGILKAQNPSGALPELIQRVNKKSKANFVKRLLDPNRKSIQDWVAPLNIATHKLGWATEDTKQGAFVYPEVQEINGELIDFTHPSHRRSEGINSAIERRDTVRMTPEQAKWFTKNYKQYYPGFKDGGILKAQEGTESLLTPHPLSPIGIALNQAKAIAKMKGDW